MLVHREGTSFLQLVSSLKGHCHYSESLGDAYVNQSAQIINTVPIGNIKQAEFLLLLGVTFRGNGRFIEHIKRKPFEANKCLCVLRSVRKEGYNQVEIDHLFQSLVLPKISHGLPVNAASAPELKTSQQFLRRCHKRCFISYAIDIYDLLEKTDRSISK